MQFVSQKLFTWLNSYLPMLLIKFAALKGILLRSFVELSIVIVLYTILIGKLLISCPLAHQLVFKF